MVYLGPCLGSHQAALKGLAGTRVSSEAESSFGCMWFLVKFISLQL